MAPLNSNRLTRLGRALRPLILLFALCGLTLSGCAHWPSADSPAAREGLQALERLRAVNADLATCKGLGQVALTTAQGVQRARLAWAAQRPGKLRMELLAVSGHPLAALASDGTDLYLRDNTRDRFYKSRSSTSLERLLHIPLKVDDLVAYLLGRVPLMATNRVALIDNPEKPGYILNLGRWWGTLSQRIVLAEDGVTVEQVIRFDADGKPAYWVEFGQRRLVGGYWLPRRLSVQTEKGHRTDIRRNDIRRTDTRWIDIRLDRFWPNASMDDAAFRLSP